MNYNNPFHKEFTNFIQLLETSSKQKRIPHSSPLKVRQIFLTLLTSILTDSGLNFGKDVLDSISNFIYQLLEKIAVIEDKTTMIQRLMKISSPKAIHSSLSAARTTIQTHIPCITKTQLDRQVEENYRQQMQIRQKHKAHSSKVILAIDNTHDRATSKYPNNQHSYIRIGQRKTWERGFNYSAIYDTTHQSYLGFLHLNNHKVKNNQRSFQPWINHLQSKIAVVENSGSNVELIEADSGYYNSELFALSYLNRLRGFDASEQFLRVITPRKFTREKAKSKWNFLLSQTSTPVSVQSMNLNYYCPELLRKACESKSIPKVDEIFQISVAQVVLVDEYGSRSKRSLEMVKIQASSLQNMMENVTEQLAASESKYLKFKARYSRKKAKFVYNRKRRRKKFKYEEEKILFDKCYELSQQLTKLKQEKENLLHSVAFFYISIGSNENPNRYPIKFIKYAQDYHERWGIENGFRDIKYKFLYKSRTQKPTRRQFYWTLGLIFYNHWQTHKCITYLQNERNRVHKIVPWDSRRSHIRKKFEKSKQSNWTAKAYLLKVWESSLSYCLKLVLAK